MNIDAKILNKILANLGNRQPSEQDASGSPGGRDSWYPQAHGVVPILLVNISWPGIGAGDQERGTWQLFFKHS